MKWPQVYIELSVNQIREIERFTAGMVSQDKIALRIREDAIEVRSPHLYPSYWFRLMHQ